MIFYDILYRFIPISESIQRNANLGKILQVYNI